MGQFLSQTGHRLASPVLQNIGCRIRFPARRARHALATTRDDIHLLYEYDCWANNRVLRAASPLSPEHYTRDPGGGFCSVRDALLHIIASERGWLTYWKEPSPSAAFLTDLWNRCDDLFHSNVFPDIAAVRLKWAEVEKEQTEFVDRVTEEALGKMIPIGTNQTQSGAPDATSRQPLLLSSGTKSSPRFR